MNLESLPYDVIVEVMSAYMLIQEIVNCTLLNKNMNDSFTDGLIKYSSDVIPFIEVYYGKVVKKLPEYLIMKYVNIKNNIKIRFRDHTIGSHNQIIHNINIYNNTEDKLLYLNILIDIISTNKYGDHDVRLSDDITIYSDKKFYGETCKQYPLKNQHEVHKMCLKNKLFLRCIYNKNYVRVIRFSWSVSDNDNIYTIKLSDNVMHIKIFNEDFKNSELITFSNRKSLTKMYETIKK